MVLLRQSKQTNTTVLRLSIILYKAVLLKLEHASGGFLKQITGFPGGVVVKNLPAGGGGVGGGGGDELGDWD